MATGITDAGTSTKKVGFAFPQQSKPQKCYKCGDKCPGLDLHFWRKICKHCRCPREDHDINVIGVQRPISALIETIPRVDVQTDSLQTAGVDRQTALQTANVDDPKTLSEIRGPESDVVLSRVISENVRSQKYISMLPSDKQKFAAQLRRKQLQKQLPLHDLHPKFCTSLTEPEIFKFQKFANKRRLKSAGVGNVTDVPTDRERKCHRCLKTIDPGGFCVFADRFGKDLLWHTPCFTCATCRELLVDMVYFYRNEDIYCERHFADSIYPRCSACDEIIFAREYTQAEKQTWHVEHFCCWYCDAPLAGQRYIAKNGNPYCIICFDRLYSKICNTCGKTITADSPGLSHGEFHWHACPHCFSCHGCSRNLINQQFLLKEGKLFCSTECKLGYVQGQITPVPHFH